MTGHLLSDAPATIVGFGTKEAATSECVLLLHGFPGEATRQNEDLGAHLSTALRMPSFVLHYRGLGRAPGSFSFRHSINEGVSSFRYLLDHFNFQRIHLLGHSWGGLVALNVFREIKHGIGRMVLLSPLTRLPSAHEIQKIAAEFDARPGFFGSQSEASVLEEIEEIRASNEPFLFAEKLHFDPGQTLIIQAINDEEVPPSVNREFCRKLRSAVKYLEIPQGHRFLEDRPALFELVIQFYTGAE